MALVHKCDGCRYKGEHQEMGFKPFGICARHTNLIEAMIAYEAKKCPFQSVDRDYDRFPFIQEMQPDEKIRTGVDLIFKGLSEMIKNIAVAFNEALTAFTDFGVNIGDWQEFLETYPNRKVVHLAFHASKDRIRKKNMARLKHDYYRRY